MPTLFEPISLSGKHVRLIPLATDHLDGLIEAVRDGELWNLWYTFIPRPEAMLAEIERRLHLQQAGSMLPWTVLDAASGMTSFMNIDAQTPRLEIGSTWYAMSVQRTPLNTEAKLLLLGHAFDGLSVKAVELRTHVMNAQSRRAIERLGAKLHGVLRHHMVMPNGTIRDTAVYSITAPEWPGVRAHLQEQLERRADSPRSVYPAR